ncbi:VENN motif pre-toxin domain-containing protein, partial [Pluralibacter gergoviae]|nr:VENN motif pre-toxin domain-containing protein [Pluralibacter gergoviae]
ETGTLGWRDIGNQADFTVEHQSAGVSTGGSYAGQFIGNMASNTLTGAHGSGHDSSTTHAAVEAGTIIIRDPGNQQQDVSTLSRDTEHAANGLSPIFDKEKEQRRLQEAQLIGEIGTQVADIARTEGKIAGEKARNDPAALKAAKEKLVAEGKPDPSRQEIADQAYASAMKPWGTGSTVQQAISAATAAVQGLAGGNIGQAISGAAAPYLAEVIHNMTTTKDANGNEVVNTQANLMAHAVLGAVVASAQGNSALAGASGGALGEYIAQQIYPGVPRDKLTEEQKQTISALGTLAAGLAGGLTGGSTADAVAGAQAGKNAVENNFLNQGHPQEYADKYKACNGNAGCEQNIRKEMAKESAENVQKLKSCWDSGDAACVADMRAKMELSDQAYTELRKQDDMAGRAYESSAQWYADIIDQCAGKCGWLEASLLKTGADGLSNIAYGALGAGSVPKPGQAGSANDIRFANEISKDISAIGKQTDIDFAAKNTKKSAGQIVVKNITPDEAINNLSANGYTKAMSKDGSVTIMSKGDTVYRFYPFSTGGGIVGAESGVPSASVSVGGKIISKIRFPGEK